MVASGQMPGDFPPSPDADCLTFLSKASTCAVARICSARSCGNQGHQNLHAGLRTSPDQEDQDDCLCQVRHLKGLPTQPHVSNNPKDRETEAAFVCSGCSDWDEDDYAELYRWLGQIGAKWICLGLGLRLLTHLTHNCR